MTNTPTRPDRAWLLQNLYCVANFVLPVALTPWGPTYRHLVIEERPDALGNRRYFWDFVDGLHVDGFRPDFCAAETLEQLADQVMELEEGRPRPAPAPLPRHPAANDDVATCERCLCPIGPAAAHRCTEALLALPIDKRRQAADAGVRVGRAFARAGLTVAEATRWAVIYVAYPHELVASISLVDPDTLEVLEEMRSAWDDIVTRNAVETCRAARASRRDDGRAA